MEFFDQRWPFAAAQEGAFNHQTTADLNRLRILGLIVRRKCLSQRQLTGVTGLQASTVSNIVRDLKSWGIVREGDQMDAERVGPKETELEIVGQAAWTVGAHLDGNGSRLTLVNAMGHVLARESVAGRTPLEEWLAALPGEIERLSQSVGLSARRLGGVNVSLPGVIDGRTGTVLVSRVLKVEGFSVRKPLVAALKCPVWVERDVVCGAYAEHYAGSSAGSCVVLLPDDAPRGATRWLWVGDGHQ